MAAVSPEEDNGKTSRHRPRQLVSGRCDLCSRCCWGAVPTAPTHSPWLVGCWLLRCAREAACMHSACRILLCGCILHAPASRRGAPLPADTANLARLVFFFRRAAADGERTGRWGTSCPGRTGQDRASIRAREMPDGHRWCYLAAACEAFWPVRVPSHWILLSPDRQQWRLDGCLPASGLASTAA